MRATKGKRNVCIFSNLFLLVACLVFCPSFSWASVLSTPSAFFLEGPLDDQAVTSSKPHYGVATFSVGIEQRFKGHEAYEGQGFSSLFVLETARGRVVARMYDPADGRFISRDPIGFEGSPWNLFQYVRGQALTSLDPSGLVQPGEIDYPMPDDTGRNHDPIPDRVPGNWPLEVLNDALDAIERSIRQRVRDGDRFPGGPDAGHRERIRREREWASRLRRRIRQLDRCERDRNNDPQVPPIVPVPVPNSPPVPNTPAAPRPWWPWPGIFPRVFPLPVLPPIIPIWPENTGPGGIPRA